MNVCTYVDIVNFENKILSSLETKNQIRIIIKKNVEFEIPRY